MRRRIGHYEVTDRARGQSILLLGGQLSACVLRARQPRPILRAMRKVSITGRAGNGDVQRRGPLTLVMREQMGSPEPAKAWRQQQQQQAVSLGAAYALS